MENEGINILIDIYYIVDFIMCSIQGKSRQFHLRLISVLINSAAKCQNMRSIEAFYLVTWHAAQFAVLGSSSQRYTARRSVPVA